MLDNPQHTAQKSGFLFSPTICDSLLWRPCKHTQHVKHVIVLGYLCPRLSKRIPLARRQPLPLVPTNRWLGNSVRSSNWLPIEGIFLGNMDAWIPLARSLHRSLRSPLDSNSRAAEAPSFLWPHSFRPTSWWACWNEARLPASPRRL